MLSKCSFALMRSVAIELDRMSVLFIVIFNAISLLVAVGPVTSGLLSSSSVCFFSLMLCGDNDFGEPIMLCELRLFCVGETDKFCGEFIDDRLLLADGGDEVAIDTGIDETGIGGCGKGI